jgi:DNA-binding transcriptional MerR regulator
MVKHQPANASAVESPLLTMEETAALLKTPTSTLRYWRYRGIGPPSFALHRRVVYRRNEVLAWLDELQAQERAGAEGR